VSIYLINEFLNIADPTEEDIANAKYHAQEGNAEAQYHLALMYDIGKVLPRNPLEAEKWYKAASASGHAAAKYYLAKMYSTQNSGIRRNDSEAEKLFKDAAELAYFAENNQFETI
jgi:hypothetical protein